MSENKTNNLIDPVCGMSVKEETEHHFEYQGEEYLFCSASCMSKFGSNPEQYIKGESSGGCCGGHSHKEESGETDPVCGMSVTSDSEHHFNYKDKERYFCSAHCVTKFKADPEQYLNKDSNAVVEVAEGTMFTCPMDPEIVQEGPGSCPICGMALEPMGAPAFNKTEYVCPMHPEVVSDAPGSCPKCGMALEPRTVEAEEDTTELDDMSRRFWYGSVLAVPVFILAMIADLVPSWLPEGLSSQTIQWIEFVLATPVVLWAGWPFYVRAVQSVRTWNLNMFTLIGLGVSVAWAYSVVAMLAPQIFPPDMLHKGGTIPVYFEAAAVITALVLLGQVLELRARSRTNAAIKLLLGLAPNIARIVREDGTEEDKIGRAHV